MVGKKSSKRSTIYNKGINATLDQFFTVKKKTTGNNTTTTSNENEISNISSSDISKQQQKKNNSSLPSDNLKLQQKEKPSSPLPTPLSDKKETKSIDTKRQRRPLADIGGESAHALALMPTRKPVKPSFTVLRDDDIDQVATEADKQQQQTRPGQSDILSSPLPTDKSNTQQQQQTFEKGNTSQQQISSLDYDYDDDTQDSQVSPNGVLMGSPESFFGDDDDNNSGIEFRVDALDSDDDDDDDNSDDHATTSFFDDDEAPFLTKTYRRTHFPTAAGATPSIPSKRALDIEDENETHVNKIIKSNLNESKTPLPSSVATEEDDDQAASSTLEFSISDSLTIPLDIKDNYHSSSEDDDDDSPLAATSTKVVVLPPVDLSQQGPSESPTPTPQLQRSQSSRTSDLSTLPMSLPLDEPVDLHVAYPVPRGDRVIDKFGH